MFILLTRDPDPGLLLSNEEYDQVIKKLNRNLSIILLERVSNKNSV
jgi:hypothetical protein